MTLQKQCEKLYSDEDLEKAKLEYKFLAPISKESLHYRKLFCKYYGEGDVCKVVPYFWLPLWSGN